MGRVDRILIDGLQGLAIGFKRSHIFLDRRLVIGLNGRDQPPHIVGGSLHALYDGPERLRDIGRLGQVGRLLDAGPGSGQLGRGPREVFRLHRLAQRDEVCRGIE